MEMCRYIYIYIKTNGYAKRIEDDETAAVGSGSAREKFHTLYGIIGRRRYQDGEHT